MTETTELAVYEDHGDLAYWFDDEKWARVKDRALMLSKSNLVPANFRGQPADCLIVLQMAIRLKIDPWQALQTVYVVHGRPGVSAQLAIALANRSGRFKKQIWFETTGSGKDLAVTARAVRAADDVEVSKTMTFQQATDAGWTRGKEGIKPFWKADPEQMLRYRSACALIRTEVPEALMGMAAVEELRDDRDVVEAEYETEQPAGSLADRMAKLRETELTHEEVIDAPVE